MKSFAPLFYIFTLVYFVVSVNAQIIKAPAQIPKPEVNWHHSYHQTLLMKLFLSDVEAEKGEGKQKKMCDKGDSKVIVNFEQALEIIKKVDLLTVGIPKIIYLVGWQYNGHDSKYPAWDEVNPKLKRSQDETALQSMKWLMEEAFKYNTTVSVHINMMDALNDSPLWNIYMENNIIAKNVDGTLRNALWGWLISYAQEWETGYAQKRIDRICEMLPLKRAGTVHIDAFHTWAPLEPKGPLSPYLGHSVEKETEAQMKIFKYWEKKGIDLTSEFVSAYRLFTFEGFQPASWHLDLSVEQYMAWPASYYCGGVDPGERGKLFGSSMHGEDIFIKDPGQLEGFLHQFCIRTLPWYYLNRLKRLEYIKDESCQKVHFEEGVTTNLSDTEYSIKQNGRLLVLNNDVFVPALWTENPTIIAYSTDGYKKKEWTLPPDWPEVRKISISKLLIDNTKTKIRYETVKDNKITLSLNKGEGVVLSPIN